MTIDLGQEIDARVKAVIGRLTVAAVVAETQRDDAAERAEAAYQLLAECIRSDQVPDASRVLQADPAFAAWYQARFPSA